MATLKQRLHRKNNSGTYDTVYLETSASLVLLASGTNVENKIAAMDTTIAGKAASTHTHSGYAATSHNHEGQNINPSAVELNPGSGAGHGGYIDFHYNGDMASDYTARIIESAKGVLNVVGSLTQNGTALSLTGHSHSASELGIGYGTVLKKTASGGSSTSFSITIKSTTKIVWILGLSATSYPSDCTGPIVYTGSSWHYDNITRVKSVSVSGTTMTITIQTGSSGDSSVSRTLYYMI